MEIEKISSSEAVSIILNSQLLLNNKKFSSGRKGIFEIIDHLGYIQIDTISVIKRAHHHILWTRRKDHTEKQLHDLQTLDKLIFEYWTHAMSYIPMKDYRFNLPRMENFRNPKSKWLAVRFNQSQKYFQPILEKIRNEGMLSSKDFENENGKKGGTWWEWKPAKTALEYLFWQGDLMVVERKGFQKYYDLTERVLPTNIKNSIPDEFELNSFFILRALQSLGIANEGEIQKFMQPGKVEISDLQITRRKAMLEVLNALCENGDVKKIQIEGNKKSFNYTLPENLISTEKSIRKKHVHFLSPFDNLIIQRERVKRLFDFDYVIECYLPEQKRKFGYFVLPILWGNKLAGRMDTKAERKSKTFLINNLVFENDFNDFENFIPDFVEKLNMFAEFNDCEKISISKCSPKKIMGIINKSIKT